MSRINVLSFFGIFWLATTGLVAGAVIVLALFGWAELLSIPVWVSAISWIVLLVRVVREDSETGRPLEYSWIPTKKVRHFLTMVYTVAIVPYALQLGYSLELTLALYLPIAGYMALCQAGYNPTSRIRETLFKQRQPTSTSVPIQESTKVIR